MSEKVVKMLRRQASGTTITRAGLRALKRAYYATPRQGRRRFDVTAAIRRLQVRELKRNQARAEYEPAACRRSRQGAFGKLVNYVLQLGRLGRK